MIHLVPKPTGECLIRFFYKGSEDYNKLPEHQKLMFSGEYLSVFCIPGDRGCSFFIGAGDKLDELRLNIKELLAAAIKECRVRKIAKLSIDIGSLLCARDREFYYDIAEGLLLGSYQQILFKQEEEIPCPHTELYGLPKEEEQTAIRYLEEAVNLAESICFARDMVNLPGNKLRPADFAEEIRRFVETDEIEYELFTTDKLKEMGLQALLSVGQSSDYPPCMVILRYRGCTKSKEHYGLIGKGVTCDTGGYCLKPPGSMLGIKGDMAGGAAVVGAVRALARNRIPTNVTAVIPICENRLSAGSMLPGDVIDTFSGKKVEVINTDAEGRLILADAVSYAVQNEKVTRILDIATLTGAVVAMLGFSVAGAVCDDDSYYRDFEKAAQKSGERYLRIPFYKEHEKMMESQIADIKNLSSKGCQTITAGLFIREFASKKPWLHLDIAGTAWVDTPLFAHQTQGATGAGTTTIYHLCRRESE